MRLNWFSPLPPARTDIADYTVRLLPVLQNYAEVTLWTNQPHWSSELERDAKVRHYQLDRMPWAEINQADLNIYHIGNNADFHGSIWQVSRQCPGLVILHDFKLHEFFIGIYRKQWGDKNSYLTQIKQYYGVEGKQAAKKFWEGVLPTEFMAENYPLTLLALENPVGAITHTQEAYHCLTQQKRWLIGYAALPYTSKFQVFKKDIPSKSPPYRVVMFGYMSPNRRLDALLKALSSLSEKSSFRLDIYGQIWDVDYIRGLVQKLNLDNSVKIHGFVKEAELDSALAKAHLAINLRYPTMGEASGSQLRIWSHALPSLVTKIGWYATLPENTVAFVRPECEIEDIQEQLRSFLANPEKFIEMGKKGRRVLEQQHSPDSYAKAIVDFADKALQFRRCSVAEKMVKKVGKEVQSWANREVRNSEIREMAQAIRFISS